MYCPRCSQQQISDEMRFCSRCGLSLSGLSEWLALSGAPDGSAQVAQRSMSSPRRKGIRRGAKVMFFAGALFPIFLLLSIAADDPIPLVFPIITFIVGLTITLYCRIFSEELPAIKSQPAQTIGMGALGTTSGGQALPPASNIPMYDPVNLASRQVRTNELAQPSSVTEHTTKLLDNE